MVVKTPENTDFIKIAEKASIIQEVDKLIEMNPNVSYHLNTGQQTDSSDILEQAKASLKDSMRLYLVSEGLGGYITYENSDKPAYIATIDPIENHAKFNEPRGEFQVLQKDGTRIYIEPNKVHDIYKIVLDEFRQGFKGLVFENSSLCEFSEKHDV